VSATAGAAELGPAGRFGLQPGMVVQELGWDDDVDAELRSGIEAVVGSALVDDDYGDVVDAVVLWWRGDDGDLVDGLVDALTDLADGGTIYVDPSDVSEAAPTAGLSTTTSLAAGSQWVATKLVSPKAAKSGRR